MLGIWLPGNACTSAEVAENIEWLCVDGEQVLQHMWASGIHIASALPCGSVELEYPVMAA